MDKAEIKEEFSARMLEMLEADRDVFIQVLMEYVEDIGMGLAMEESTGDTIPQSDFHEQMRQLLEEE